MGALQSPAQLWPPAVLYLWSFRAGEKTPGASAAPRRHQLSLWDSKALSPQIHLLGNGSEAAGAGKAERREVCLPVPHQAGVTQLCLFSCPAALARGGPSPWAPASSATSMGGL